MLCFACKVQWNDHPKCIFSYSGSILSEFGAATIFFSFLLPVPLYPSLLLISTITSFKCIARLTFVGDNITLSRRNPENLITIMCEVDSGDLFLSCLFDSERDHHTFSPQERWRRRRRRMWWDDKGCSCLFFSESWVKMT